MRANFNLFVAIIFLMALSHLQSFAATTDHAPKEVILYSDLMNRHLVQPVLWINKGAAPSLPEGIYLSRHGYHGDGASFTEPHRLKPEERTPVILGKIRSIPTYASATRFSSGEVSHKATIALPQQAGSVPVFAQIDDKLYAITFSGKAIVVPLDYAQAKYVDGILQWKQGGAATAVVPFKSFSEPGTSQFFAAASIEYEGSAKGATFVFDPSENSFSQIDNKFHNEPSPGTVPGTSIPAISPFSKAVVSFLKRSNFFLRSVEVGNCSAALAPRKASERDNLCPCGSGKQFKKCCLN